MVEIAYIISSLMLRLLILGTTRIIIDTFNPQNSTCKSSNMEGDQDISILEAFSLSSRV